VQTIFSQSHRPKKNPLAMSNDIFDSFPGYMGWKPDQVDDRDFLYIPTFRVPWGSEARLRTVATKDGYWNKVYDQGQTGSCTANAVAAVLAFELNRSNRTKAGDAGSLSPSRSFIYYNARKGYATDDDDDEQEIVPDDGSEIRLAMRSLQRFGVCDDASWPLRKDTVKWYPGPYAFYEAQRNMIRSYQYKRLDVKRADTERAKIMDNQDVATMDKDGDTVLNSLRSCLTQGHPVALGFSAFFPANEQGRGIKFMDDEEEWVLPAVPKERRHYGPEQELDRHAVLAIGFQDRKKKDRSGRVLCQNSWGSDKTKPGRPFIWMPYNYITDFSATMDFWMIDLSGFPSKL
jgi:C1A family cysteine protease